MVHERAHTGIRPLACPHCPATFLNSSNLASHKRRHLPPTYHCQMCAKSFKFKEVRHHVTIKNILLKIYLAQILILFSCISHSIIRIVLIVFRLFTQALQNHLATQHSTVKPHICNSCGKAFSTRCVTITYTNMKCKL